MIKNTFGATGLQVSAVGFGGAPIGFLATEQRQVANILNLLLDAGVNLIDTAAAYAGSEEAIARAVGHRRDEFILVSKCGSHGATEEAPAWSARLVTETVEASLRRLQTDHLDVMLLHTCGLPTLQAGEALGALVKAREAGKIRFAGYSGDNETGTFAASLPDVAVIETSISIADQANLQGLLPAAVKRNIGIIAKRPVANAAWKDLEAQHGLYKDYAAEYTKRLLKLKLDPAACGVDGPPELSWPEMALRFTLSQPGLHTAIIGTTNPENARRNLQAAAKGPLSPQAVEAIRQAWRVADPEGKWQAES